MKWDELEQQYGSITAAINKLREELRPVHDKYIVGSYVVRAHYRSYPRKRAITKLQRLK
jgi:hypothetical protein